jgi:hypothetical protein
VGPTGPTQAIAVPLKDRPTRAPSASDERTLSPRYESLYAVYHDPFQEIERLLSWYVTTSDVDRQSWSTLLAEGADATAPLKGTTSTPSVTTMTPVDNQARTRPWA